MYLRWMASGLLFLARIALAAILLLSACAKLRNPVMFLESVYLYELLGPGGAFFVALFLPPLEFVLAIALLLDCFALGAALTSTILGVAFLVAQLSALHRGLSISCGCFGGAIYDEVGLTTLLRALMVVILGAAMVVLRDCGKLANVR